MTTKKPSDALKLVLERFEDGRNESKFICNCLPGGEYEAASRVASLHIKELLGGVTTFESWLVKEENFEAEDLFTPEGVRKRVTTRIAWLKDMIRHFESRGQ